MTVQVKYATTAAACADIAHAVIIGDDGEERAACRRGLNLGERRYTARQVDHTHGMLFCLACDRKVERHTCRYHGMYAGSEQCPTCSDNERDRRILKEREDAQRAKYLNQQSFDEVPATRPADQQPARFDVINDGVLSFHRPVLGTSLRGEVHHEESTRDGYGESWKWTRTIRGQVYDFTLVRMPVSSTYPDGQVRIFVSKFNGYCGGPRFGCAWSPVRKIAFVPEPAPVVPATKPTLEREVPVRTRHISGDTEEDRCKWRRVVRGRLYEFEIVTRSRMTVFTMDRCDGDRCLEASWTRLHTIVIPNPVIGCGHVGLGERHRFVPATYFDVDRAYDSCEELCMLPEDAEVHRLIAEPQQLPARRGHQPMRVERTSGVGGRTPNVVDLEINQVLQTPLPCPGPERRSAVLDQRRILARLRRELADLVAADGGWPRWAVQATEAAACAAEVVWREM